MIDSRRLAAMLAVTATSTLSQEEDRPYNICRGSRTEPNLEVYIESAAQKKGRHTWLRFCSTFGRWWLVPGVGGLLEGFRVFSQE